MRLSPADIAQHRARIGTDGLDTALLCAQLLEMVEKLQAQLDAAEALARRSREELAGQVNRLERRLAELDQAAAPACPACAETRRVVAQLHRATAP